MSLVEPDTEDELDAFTPWERLSQSCKVSYEKVYTRIKNKNVSHIVVSIPTGLRILQYLASANEELRVICINQDQDFADLPEASLLVSMMTKDITFFSVGYYAFRNFNTWQSSVHSIIMNHYVLLPDFRGVMQTNKKDKSLSRNRTIFLPLLRSQNKIEAKSFAEDCIRTVELCNEIYHNSSQPQNKVSLVIQTDNKLFPAWEQTELKRYSHGHPSYQFCVCETMEDIEHNSLKADLVIASGQFHEYGFSGLAFPPLYQNFQTCGRSYTRYHQCMPKASCFDKYKTTERFLKNGEKHSWMFYRTNQVPWIGYRIWLNVL